MTRRLWHHRLRESLNEQELISRSVVDLPERRRLHVSADLRTTWVLAADEAGDLREVATFERVRAQSGEAAAREALEITGPLPHGGLVVVRSGHIPPERSLAAWHHQDEWHGLVAPHGEDAEEIQPPDHVPTAAHLIARVRTALDDAGAPDAGTPERAHVVHDVVARLDGASRQRAAQDLEPDSPQSGDPDRLVGYVLEVLAPPEEDDAGEAPAPDGPTS